MSIFGAEVVGSSKMVPCASTSIIWTLIDPQRNRWNVYEAVFPWVYNLIAIQIGWNSLIVATSSARKLDPGDVKFQLDQHFKFSHSNLRSNDIFTKNWVDISPRARIWHLKANFHFMVLGNIICLSCSDWNYLETTPWYTTW